MKALILTAILLSTGCTAVERFQFGPDYLKCPQVKPIGGYSVKHLQDSRSGVHPTTRWRCYIASDR